MSTASEDQQGEKLRVSVLTTGLSSQPKSSNTMVDENNSYSLEPKDKNAPIIDVSGVMTDLMQKVGNDANVLIDQRMSSLEERLTNTLMGKITGLLQPPLKQQVAVQHDQNAAKAADQVTPNVLGDHNATQVADLRRKPPNTEISVEGVQTQHRRGRSRSRSRSRHRSHHRYSRSRSRSRRSRRSRSRSRSRRSRRGRSSSRSHSKSISQRSVRRSSTASTKSALVDDGDCVSIIVDDPRSLTLDQPQTDWEKKVECYGTEEKWGAEVDSGLASACKTFWQNPLPEERFAELTTSGQTPANCQFLKVRKVNTEIFTATAPNIRSGDVALQKIQEANVSLASCLVQSINMMENSSDTLSVRDKLSDALQLSGHLNNMLEQHRKEAFKVSLPVEKKVLTSMPVKPDAVCLFGDDLDVSIDEIKKKNKLKKEFSSTPKQDGSKQPPRNTSGNAGSHQKSQGGSHSGNSSWKKYDNKYDNKDTRRYKEKKEESKENRSSTSRYPKSRNNKPKQQKRR